MEQRRRPSKDGGSRPRARLPLWKKALFSLIPGLAFFGGVELVLFLLDVRPVLEDGDPYVGFASTVPLFVEERRTDGSAVMVTAPSKIRFFNPQRFPTEKGPRAYRIFCLGGSTTYGRPYDDATSFCGWLREMLPEADPSRDWEVINAGGISYASYRVALVMEELVRYGPDLFIIYSGHNEFLERRTYPELVRLPASARGLGGLLARSRTYAVLSRSLKQGPSQSSTASEAGRELLPGEVETLLDAAVGPAAYRRDDDLRLQVVAHYKYNIARMIDMARSHGAGVLVVQPASNLRHSSPFKSEPRAGLSRADERRFAALFEAAESAYAAARLDDALRLVAAAISIDDRYAHIHYLRGQILAGLGRGGGAKEAFERARDEDVCPLRALSSLEEALRAVAAERAAPLIDFVAIAAGEAPGGIPGDELFLDHVHPSISGHRLLALALLEAMERQGIVTPAATWNRQALERVRERVETRVDPQAQGTALKNLAKVLGWAGKFDEARKLALRATELVPGDSEAYFTLGVALERTGDLDGAARRYEEVLGIEPGYAEARKNLGRVAEKQGRLDDAAAHYRAALGLRADYAEVHASLGNVLARQGESARAEAHLQQALRIEPENAAALQKLGVLLLERGALKEAARRLEEALRVAPGDARAHHNLGVVYAEGGRVSEARFHYAEALRLRPDHAGTHDNLGNLYAAEGKIPLAADHFGHALGLEPHNTEVRRKLAVMAERFEAVLRVRPDDREAHYYLGAVLAVQGERGRGASHYQRAIELARAEGASQLVEEISARLRSLSDPASVEE